MAMGSRSQAICSYMFLLKVEDRFSTSVNLCYPKKSYLDFIVILYLLQFTFALITDRSQVHDVRTDVNYRIDLKTHTRHQQRTLTYFSWYEGK